MSLRTATAPIATEPTEPDAARNVHNEGDGERIEQAVAGLPGVTHVDNQLIVQNILGDIKGKSKDY